MSKPKRFAIKSISRKSGLVREYIVTVDEADAHLLRSYYWIVSNVQSSENKTGFMQVSRTTATGSETLHHAILGVPAGERVYHINGDPLDNRRANLMRRNDRIREIE